MEAKVTKRKKATARAANRSQTQLDRCDGRGTMSYPPKIGQ